MSKHADVTAASPWIFTVICVLGLSGYAYGRPDLGRSIDQDVNEWLDWIRHKVTGGDDVPSDREPIIPKPTDGAQDGLDCSIEDNYEVCTIRVVGDGNSPDPSALHRLLRFPTERQLAARALQPLHVIIRGGAYSSVPLSLPNNTHITIEEGAALVFDSAGPAFYDLWVAEALPTYGHGEDAGGPLRYRAHMDCAACRDVIIDGGGVIDGGGERWWAMHSAARAGDSGAVSFMSRDRPSIWEGRSCQNIVFADVTLRSPPWRALHLWNCSDVHLQRLTVQSPSDAQSPTGSAVTVDSSRSVIVDGAQLSSGTDCIAVQAGIGAAGRKLHLPSRRIQLQQIQCAASAGAGLHLGPQLEGGIRNISATDWTVSSSRDAIAIDTSWGCGGALADITASGWVIGNSTRNVLHINGQAQGCLGGWQKTVTSNITLRDFHLAAGLSRPHIRVQGGRPLGLQGFHVDESLQRGAACWSAVYVSNICRAAPGFLILLYLLAALLACMVGAIVAIVGACYLHRRGSTWRERWRRKKEAAMAEETLNFEAVELINLDPRRNAPLQDSLEDPARYVLSQQRR